MNSPALRALYCGVWLALFFIALALAARSGLTGDLVALAGATGIYLAAVLAYGWYGLLDLRVRKARLEDWEQIEVWRRQVHWFLIAAYFLCPGAWIGETARSPVLISAVYMGAFTAFRWLGHKADQILAPEEASASPLKTENHLLDAVLILFGAVLGVGARWLLSR